METILKKAEVVANDKPGRSTAFVERVGNLLPKAHWPWLLLAVSVGLIAWQTSFLTEVLYAVHGFLTGVFEDTTRGANAAYEDGYRKSNPNSKEGLSLLLNAFIGVFALALIAGLMVFFIWFHYKFLYQQLLRRQRSASGYAVLYVFWLFVYWRGLVFLFNSFKTEFDAESISYATFTTAFCILYAFGQSYRQNQRQKQVLVQQRTQAELEALKAQVNPHFLFNSLNNIYGTAIVEDSPRTAESIQQLSGIIRYVMEESRLQTTDVRRELRFIDDYVELQRVRIPDQENIQITTDIEWDEKPAKIVPLLLNPLIENAFKYGISIQHPCFVRIRLRVQDGTLKLTTENSILPVVDSTRTDLEKGTGIGLANVRQRLALAYPDRHKLTVDETSDVFLVDLTIKL